MQERSSDKVCEPVREQRPMLRNAAHARFMEALYSGQLRPGELVSQRELCEMLELPMGPLREALKRLEAEMVVTLIPQRGIRILDIGEKTINDIFQMRALMEIDGLHRFMDRGELNEALDLLRRTEEAYSKPDAETTLDLDAINRITTLDHEMHQLLVDALDNEIASELFTRMLGRLRLSRLAFRLRHDRDRRAFQEHLDILGHVIKGDKEGASSALKRHLHHSRRRALGLPD